MKTNRLSTIFGAALAAGLLFPSTPVLAQDKPAAAPAKVADRVLIDMSAADAVDRIIPDGQSLEVVSSDVVTYKSDAGEGKAIVVTYKTGSQYPTASMMPEGDVWNLSDYTNLRIRITNPGETKTRGVLRLDNPGDWQKNPWLNKEFEIAGGETKTLDVNLNGYAGNGKRFQKGQLLKINMFLVNPAAETKLRVEDVRAVAEGAE